MNSEPGPGGLVPNISVPTSQISQEQVSPISQTSDRSPNTLVSEDEARETMIKHLKDSGLAGELDLVFYPKTVLKIPPPTDEIIVSVFGIERLKKVQDIRFRLTSFLKGAPVGDKFEGHHIERSTKYLSVIKRLQKDNPDLAKEFEYVCRDNNQFRGNSFTPVLQAIQFARQLDAGDGVIIAKLNPILNELQNAIDGDEPSTEPGAIVKKAYNETETDADKLKIIQLFEANIETIFLILSGK